MKLLLGISICNNDDDDDNDNNNNAVEALVSDLLGNSKEWL